MSAVGVADAGVSGRSAAGDDQTQASRAIERALVALGHGDIQVMVHDPYDTSVPASSGAELAAVVAPVLLTDAVALVGPVAGSTANSDRGGCAQCLRLTWAAGTHPVIRAALGIGTRRPAGAVPRSLAATAADFIAAVIAMRLMPQCAAPGRLVDVVDIATFMVRTLPVPSHPRCTWCATASIDSSLEPSAQVAAGAYRRRAPHEYRITPAQFVDADVGLLGMRVLEELDGRLQPRAGGQFWLGKVPVQWSGTAPTFRTSRLIGLLEGLERQAGAQPSPAVVAVEAAFADLGPRAVDPVSLGLLASSPTEEAYSPQQRARWVAARSLATNRTVLVPEQRVYDQPDRGPRWWRECSNGAASGATLVEAVLYGLFEVLERDAALVAWHCGRPLPEIDQGSLTDATVRHDLQRLALSGLRARCFDARADHVVPVVITMIESAADEARGVSFGCAARLDPQDALRAALGEAAAVAPKLHRAAREHGARLRAGGPVDVQDHWRLYALPSASLHVDFLRQPTGTVSVADVGDRLSTPVRDLASILDTVVTSVLTDCPDALDVLFVELTTRAQAELGLRCAKVVVPGLLPIDFGARHRATSMPRLHRRHAHNPHPHPFP